MGKRKQNYYGSLCTEMYEILHEQAPRNELNFYLSYAEKGKKILGCVVNRFVLYYANVKKGCRENGECIRTT